MTDVSGGTHVALEAPGGRPTIAEPSDVPMRVPVPVHVTHYSGPTKLSLRYRRLPGGVSSDDFYIAPGRRHVYEAAIGMFCMVCKDSSSSSTRVGLRALVTDVRRSRGGMPVMVEVLYVDSGGTGAVRLDAVYPMDADAAAEPLRAVSCCIRNVTPTTASSHLDLQELSKDGQPLYEALFCDVTDAGVYVVDLYVKLPTRRASKLDVGEFLVRHGYAERFKDPLAAPANGVGAWQTESYQNGESDRPSLSLLPVHAEDPTGDIFLPESEPKSAPRENSFEIKVTFTCSPDHFYGQKSSTAKKLCDVHSIARTCTTPEGKARKGTYQIYRESAQETGARVRIEDVLLESGKCKVFMIDYGNRKTVSSSCLYRADPRLFGIEPLALRFQLVGIAPRRQWTEAAVSRFLELTRSDAPLTAVVVGRTKSCHEFNDTVYMVQLFNKVHGSVAECMAPSLVPFDPMREDYHSPLNSYRVNTDDPGVAASNFAAVNRSHRVCKFYAARGSCRQGDRCTFSHVSAEPGSALLHVTEPVVDPVRTLQPPEVGVRVLGHVSAYASPSCFYLVFPHGRRSLDRLADEGVGPRCGETLASLMAELQDVCCAQAGFHEDRLVVRAEGELVAAQSSEDGRWYRAQVVTAEEGDLVTVFFVDFGFSERVPATQVKSLNPRFTHLPLQALEACLEADDDLEPSSEAFEDCVNGRDLMVEVVRVVQGLSHVRLFFVHDGNLCSVRDSM